MRRIRRPSHATVVAYVALFVALTGGTAAALSGSNTVFTDDIANDTQPAGGGNPAGGLVAADLRPSSVGSSEVLNNGLALSDLNATSRPHKLEFSAPIGSNTPIATVGHLGVRGTCSGGAQPVLTIYLRNLATQTGTMNALLTSQTGSDGPVSLYTVGQFVGAGVEITLDNSDQFTQYLAAGSFNRVEGQVVFQTPGRVTTIDFHAFTGASRCEFYGTAVTSSLN
jgi:hypothetical protein